MEDGARPAASSLLHACASRLALKAAGGVPQAAAVAFERAAGGSTNATRSVAISHMQEWMVDCVVRDLRKGYEVVLHTVLRVHGCFCPC